MIDQLADADAIFTGDSGGPMVWMLRHISSNGKRRAPGKPAPRQHGQCGRVKDIEELVRTNFAD